MKKPKALLFVEFHKRRDTIIAAKEEGFKAILLSKEKTNIMEDLFDEIIQLNLEEKPELDEMVRDLKSRYEIEGILSNYEHFVVQRSYLASRFGLPSTSVYGACCTRNKVMQREALSMLEENIDYQIVSSKQEALKAFSELGKEVFLKSIAGIKSTFVEYVSSPEQLEKVWNDFQNAQLHLDPHLFNDFSYFDFDFPYPDPKKHLLIEKAYSGQQIAVAALVGNHQVWTAPSPTDVYTAKDIEIHDSYLAFRILPSALPERLVKKANDVTKKVIRVLGLKNCGVHAELIVTPQGDIKIIEVASRLGGYRGFMYQEVYGIDLPHMLIRSVINKPLKIKAAKPKTFLAMHEVFPKREGIFKKVKNIDRLKMNANVVRVDEKSQPGEKIGPASRGYSPVITFAITAESEQEIHQKSLYWQKELQVLLD